MKRLCSLFLAVLLCMSIGCGCKKNKETTSSDLSWQQVSDKKQWTVGVYPGHFPLCYADGETFTGYDVDLITELASRLGLKVVYYDVSSSDRRTEELLADGTVDCIIGAIPYSAELERTYLLMNAYLTDAQVIVVPEDSACNSLAELSGLSLCIATNSQAHKALQSSPLLLSSFSSVAEVDTESTAMHALTSGEAQAAVVNQTVADYFIAHGNALRLLKNDSGEVETLGTQSYVIAFGLSSTALLKKVEEAYATMKRDAVTQQLFDRWFTSGTSSDSASEASSEQAAGAGASSAQPIA